MKYTIGLDYGTNSVRAILVEIGSGRELSGEVWQYAHGNSGVIEDSQNPNLARQHPEDYLTGARITMKAVVEKAQDEHGINAADIIGIGVDTTGSTPMPVLKDNKPLVSDQRFSDNKSALAWLWKDHTSTAEAEAITEAAAKLKPHYLSKVGGTYSSEWFWAKIWKALKVAPEVFEAAYTWIEIADWIPAVLCGVSEADAVKRGICAAGHKGLYHVDWGGYPEKDFLSTLDPALAGLRDRLPGKVYSVQDEAGKLSEEWARQTGLVPGTPVAVGAFDAHLGGVGSGIKPGTLVKIVGTSTCDMMVAPEDQEAPDIKGIAGIVPGSILPGYYGLEAGQSAVGDIFNWFVNVIQPGGSEKGSHQALTASAEKLGPGTNGLLALDWHNGNRTVLVDQRLSGLILGLSLQSTPAEIYRALVEATAFGARVIVERFEDYGQKVDEILNCGGISVKNTMVMQIYADVMNRPMKISRSSQTPALGAAIAAAVVAGEENGGYSGFEQAVEEMTGIMDTVFTPIPEHVKIYEKMYGLYKTLHDAFGTREWSGTLANVMKELLDIRDRARMS